MYKKMTFKEAMEQCENICKYDKIEPIDTRDVFYRHMKLIGVGIVNFFDCRGSRELISSIYSKLKNNELPYNKVDTIDVNKVVAMYKEYNESMLEYIMKILDASSDKADYTDYINKAIKNDHDYICKLMNDTCDKYSLDEAMSNVEYLIDVKNDVEWFRKNYDDIMSRNSELADLCGTMYATSVVTFTKNILPAVYNCFEAITASIEHRTPAGPEKTIEKTLL